MPPPLDPRIEQAIQRLLEALNGLAISQTDQQRLATGLMALGAGFDVGAVDIPDVREYDRDDAIQLVREIGNSVFFRSLEQGQRLTDAQWDEMFFHILATLPEQLLPGAAPVRRLPPGQPVAQHIQLADNEVFVRSANIRRFPRHALIGMQEGAAILALLQNGRISRNVFDDFTADDPKTRQAAELYRVLRDNMPSIINAATAEAKGDDFARAVSKVVAAESKDGVVTGPTESLFPVFPGFGAPEARRFTEEEEKALREKPKDLVKDTIPTGAQLDTKEETQARLRFLDDLEDDIQAAETLSAKQALVDGAPAQFETVRQQAVQDAATTEAREEAEKEAEQQAEDFAERFDTPAKFRAELANVLPTASQLETPEEQAALKKFIDDQLDEAQAAEAFARSRGLPEETVFQAKLNVIRKASLEFEGFRLGAVREAGVAAEEKVAEEAPTSVADKNAILSAAFQTSQFQAAVRGTPLEGREFESLTDEAKVLARSLIAGMSKEEAEFFASQSAPFIAQISQVQEIEATEQEKIAELAKRREDFDPEAAEDFINDALQRQGFLPTDLSPRAKAGLIQELLAAEGQPSVLFPEIEERLSDLVREERAAEQITTRAREAFVDARRARTAVERAALGDTFDDLFLGQDAPGFGPGPVSQRFEERTIQPPGLPGDPQPPARTELVPVFEQLRGLTFAEGIQLMAERHDPFAIPARATALDASGGLIISTEIDFTEAARRSQEQTNARIQAEEEADAEAIRRQDELDRLTVERELETLRFEAGGPSATIPPFHVALARLRRSRELERAGPGPVRPQELDLSDLRMGRQEPFAIPKTAAQVETERRRRLRRRGRMVVRT